MHLVIVGGGVVGITTAWACLERNWQVTVVEGKAELARGACFANGAQISVSHPHPWSSPQAPWIALDAIGNPDAPFHWQPKWDCTEARWLARFLRECLPTRHERNTRAIATLAKFSLTVLRAWRSRLDLHYDEVTRGILHLFLSEKDWAHGKRHAADLDALGIRARLLSPDEAIAIEPALARHRARLVGALHAEEDESGDARAFTLALAERCRERGAAILTHVTACGWQFGADRRAVLMVRRGCGDSSPEPLEADGYILCAGIGTKALAEPLLGDVPIHPVKGYSLTVPIRDEAAIPTLSLTDESHRIVASRLGTRWRIAGTAELAGTDERLTPERLAPLYRWGKTWGGEALDWSAAQEWAGLRPMTPSGVPLIGPTRQRNVWINSGHGSLGWTLACGSATAIAAIIANEPPPVEFPFTSPV
ncbi:D-amino acid dehydrogenase [Hydrogenophilus islandicus]